MQVAPPTPRGDVQIEGSIRPGYAEILTPGALDFLARLQRIHGADLRALIEARQRRQAALDTGATLDFDPKTEAIRQAPWTCAPVPADLLDRRVEITGPVDRKMVINALNSGARCFMADFEDSTSPTWHNIMGGQVNLRDAVHGTIRHHDPRTGRVYTVDPDPAVLLVRPRGLHLHEAGLTLDQRPLSASLVDFGLFVFHNAAALIAKGSGPYLYLPKLEHHTEAAWWDAVFRTAQDALGIEHGTIKATVLIETLPAAFQLDEILHALRDHAAGLNCGRWDYIFSAIKVRRADPTAVFPDRSEVTMSAPFMQAYTRRVVAVAHRRGVHAMGGMAAQIPIRTDPIANAEALDQVRADKEREVRGGHDGTWVAHPGLVQLATEVFDAIMPGPHQQHFTPKTDPVTPAMLLAVPAGRRTEAGLRLNLRVAVIYLAAWLRGRGCVPIDHRMEDAATAEICRAQVWQWVRHRASLADGRIVDADLVRTLMAEEIDRLDRADDDAVDLAARLLLEWTTAEGIGDFFTTAATRYLPDPKE